MNIAELLKTNKSGVSFEFFPPKTERGMEKLKKAVHELEVYDPLYVSVTYGAGGKSQDKTKEAVCMIKKETDLIVMPHLTCISATKQSIDSILKEYIKNGFDSILALRGDYPEDENHTQGDFQYAKDLVDLIKQYNHFTTGIAVYPEGHQESPSLEKDIEYTKHKIDAGADFGITQMFFDNKYFYNFIELIREKGVKIPIVPGIIPITDLDKIEKFASLCKVTIPLEIKEKMTKVSDNPEEMKKIGIEFTVNQCRDLIENNVKFFHFFTLNRSDIIKEILDALDL